jgi:hypothetical protein
MSHPRRGVWICLGQNAGYLLGVQAMIIHGLIAGEIVSLPAPPVLSAWDDGGICRNRPGTTISPRCRHNPPLHLFSQAVLFAPPQPPARLESQCVT